MVGVVILPEKIIEKIKNNILPQWKISFISAVVIGLITHLYKITNWLPNWDSLVFRYDAQNMVSMGRWFLPVASAFSSFYDLPWVTGLMAILFHALGAVVIVEIFKVKKTVTACLIGAMVVSFPTVTSVMMYNYVADAYALSFLFAVLAAFFLTREKPKYLISVILISLSVGIYQAYITVTIMLLLVFLIKETFLSEVKVKDILIKCLKFLITGGIGMGLYYVALMVILKITNTALLDYQGFGDAAALSGINIFASLYVIKEIFLNYFFNFTNGLNLFSIINLLIFALTVVLYVTDIIKNKITILKVLFLLVFVILLPIGANILAFVNSSIDYHNLMKMGYLGFYLIFILAYEKTYFEKINFQAIKSWLVLALSAVLIFNYIIIANVSYHKLNMAYEKSIGTLNRIADRIEQTEGSNKCDSVLVLGALEDTEEYSSYISLDMTGTTDGHIIRADDEIVGQSVLCSALNDYCGKKYKFLSGEEKQELLGKIDENNLSNWPDKNSIQIIDKVIIIKLGD